ncbi:MAG: hypothetical protein P4L26_12515 [Terracidiphilus sp.]|nr:hypothetical protein [Terracidiphilus sp.]
MRRHLLFLAIAAAILAPALRALVLQAQEPEPPITAQVPACPSTATLDHLISAIDSAVSGPGNQDRTCFRQLFLPDARLIPIRVAADGTATPRILTVQDWIDAVAKRGSAVFYEHQVKVRTETWAHMAHLWSTYETRTTPNGTPPEGKAPEGRVLDRGINSIQAVYDGKRWQVIEILWQAEVPADPVPQKYLP